MNTLFHPINKVLALSATFKTDKQNQFVYSKTLQKYIKTHTLKQIVIKTQMLSELTQKNNSETCPVKE